MHARINKRIKLIALQYLRLTHLNPPTNSSMQKNTRVNSTCHAATISMITHAEHDECKYQRFTPIKHNGAFGKKFNRNTQKLLWQ